MILETLSFDKKIINEIATIYTQSKNVGKLFTKDKQLKITDDLQAYFECSKRETLFITVIIALLIEKNQCRFQDMMEHFEIDIFTILEYKYILDWLHTRHFVYYDLDKNCIHNTQIILNTMLLDAIINNEKLPEDFKLYQQIKQQKNECLFMESNIDQNGQ